VGTAGSKREVVLELGAWRCIEVDDAFDSLDGLRYGVPLGSEGGDCGREMELDRVEVDGVCERGK
jgi:hypothetical protein